MTPIPSHISNSYEHFFVLIKGYRGKITPPPLKGRKIAHNYMNDKPNPGNNVFVTEIVTPQGQKGEKIPVNTDRHRDLNSILQHHTVEMCRLYRCYFARQRGAKGQEWEKRCPIKATLTHALADYACSKNNRGPIVIIPNSVIALQRRGMRLIFVINSNSLTWSIICTHTIAHTGSNA